MKRQVNNVRVKTLIAFIVVIVIICAVFLFPLFKPGFYVSHDGEAHVARFAAYFKAFQDGQIPPRWAGNLNSGYGSPLFIFFYPLPGYMASIIHLFGFELETVFKILIYLSFILGPVFLFVWLRRYSKDEVAFISSVIYSLLPYRFLDVYVRGDIAELISFVFIPLIFLFIDKSRKEKKIFPIILGGLAYALLILSHNGIAAIFSPVFLSYALVFSKKPKDFILLLNIFVIGLLLSAFFWFPSVIEGKFVYTKLFVEDLYKENFVPFWKLFYSNWGFGPDINLKDGLSPQIGILYGAIPFLILPFLTRVPRRKEIIFWFLVFMFAVLMTTSLSKSLWEVIPIIKLMGYPWRFTALSGFAACMIIFYTLNFINKRIILFLILASFMVTTLSFVKVNERVDRNDDFYYSYQGTTDYHRRTSTIWTEGDFWKKAPRQIEIIAGKGRVDNITRKSNTHTFTAYAETSLQILDNTVYFPGWQVYVNGQKTPIEFQDMNHRGLITFSVTKGMHNIEVVFKESPVRLFSNMVSLFSIVGISSMVVIRRFIPLVKKR